MDKIGIPRPLGERRMHSLMGIWLTIFLMQHLFINSQAAYFFGEDGKGFIRAANSIHELPYLPIIELLILAFPILVHGIWGIKYLFTAKYNSFGNTGVTPYLPQYPRNHAYTWQRITSYLLVIGIIAHVVQMRFLDSPSHAHLNNQEYHMVLVNLDEGIFTLAERLDVQLYDSEKLQIYRDKKGGYEAGFFHAFFDSMKEVFDEPSSFATKAIETQDMEEKENFLKTLEKYNVKKGQAIAIAKDYGTAELLMVRETFKIPIMMALYTVFVLAACFHGFNGLWTFLISWGIAGGVQSQRLFLKISYGLMLLFSFLGLSAIYTTYWINLKN